MKDIELCGIMIKSFFIFKMTDIKLFVCARQTHPLPFQVGAGLGHCCSGRPVVGVHLHATPGVSVSHAVGWYPLTKWPMRPPHTRKQRISNPNPDPDPDQPAP